MRTWDACVGCVNATDGGASNPWDTLSNYWDEIYWDELVARVAT